MFSSFPWLESLFLKENLKRVWCHLGTQYPPSISAWETSKYCSYLCSWNMLLYLKKCIVVIFWPKYTPSSHLKTSRILFLRRTSTSPTIALQTSSSYSLTISDSTMSGITLLITLLRSGPRASTNWPQRAWSWRITTSSRRVRHLELRWCRVDTW